MINLTLSRNLTELSNKLCNYLTGNEKKTYGIRDPRKSSTRVLIRRSPAYLWREIRHPGYSDVYGRTRQISQVDSVILYNIYPVM